MGPIQILAAVLMLSAPVGSAVSQSAPAFPPFAPPNPCPTPPTVTKANMSRFVGKWQEIKPSGCAFGLYPPKGLRVLLYFPSECIVPGQCGWMAFGRYGYEASGSGFSNEKLLLSSPSHWMIVAKPRFR